MRGERELTLLGATPRIRGKTGTATKQNGKQRERRPALSARAAPCLFRSTKRQRQVNGGSTSGVSVSVGQGVSSVAQHEVAKLATSTETPVDTYQHLRTQLTADSDDAG